MQFACDYCQARNHADIADIHVVGNRLVSVCRTCGREVVVVGGPGENADVGGALLPDLSDDLIESGASLDGVAAPPETPETPETPESPESSESRETTLPSSFEPAAATLPVSTGPTGAPPASQPVEFPILVEGRKGVSPVWIGLAVLALAGAGAFLLLGPWGSPPKIVAAKEAAPPLPSPTKTEPTPETASAAKPVDRPAETGPVPDAGPSVVIKELAVEKKPTAAAATPVPKTSIRDAAAVIDPAAIEEALIRVRPGYRLCAVSDLKRNPEAKAGTLGIVLTIAPTGEVVKVAFDRAEVASSLLGQCVQAQFVKVIFPPFDGPAVVLRRSLDLTVRAD